MSGAEPAPAPTPALLDSPPVAPRDPKQEEEELERLAVEELLREAVQGAARAELVGPSGWVKSSLPKTNKKFLCNTIRHAVASNRYHQIRSDRRRTISQRSPKRERSPVPYDRKNKSRLKY